MPATSIDLVGIQTDATNSKSAFRTLIGATCGATGSTDNAVLRADVAMVRFIQGQYQKTIEALELRVSINEKHVEALTSETMKCFEDRAVLKGRVEALEKQMQKPAS